MPDADVIWSDVFEGLVTSFAGEIPVVGGAVSALIEAFWPSSAPSIWDDIQAQVKSLVDVEIMMARYTDRMEDIAGLESSMRDYSEDPLGQKGGWLTNAMGTANTIRSRLTTLDDQDTIHFIPLAVTFSHLDLTLLAEQLAHGNELWPDKQDGSAGWAKQLSDTRQQYTSFFQAIYPKWLEWRKPKITQNDYTAYSGRGFADTAYGDAQDQVTGAAVHYEQYNGGSGYFRDSSTAAYNLYLSQAIARMASALESTFHLNAYDPATANDPPIVDPALATLTLGPFCPAALGFDGRGNVRPGLSDAPGNVTDILCEFRQGPVTLLQLHYIDPAGHTYAGARASWVDPPPASPYRMTVPPGSYCTGFDLWIDEQTITTLSVYIDGAVSWGPLGSSTGTKVSAVVAAQYGVYSAAYAESVESNLGPGVMTLCFKHKSLLNFP